LEVLETYCQQYQLSHHLDVLFGLAQTTELDLQHFQSKIEKFDKIKADGMCMAEKCCCPLCMGLVQFFPELNQWHLQKELWQLVIRHKVGHQVWANTIHHLATAYISSILWQKH